MTTKAGAGRGAGGKRENEARALALDARESALDEREASLRGREAERAGEERRSVAVREVNEQLVLTMLRADELAEQAEAGRAEVAASEERFRSLVTASAAMVVRADAKGELHVDERRWEEYTGLSAEAQGDDAPGEGWLRAVHPDDRAGLRAAWTNAVAGGDAFTHQHRLRRRDGSYAWMSVRAVPIPEQGEVREWIGMVTDVSDRVRLEEAREQFIAILGHDLRSPLTIIHMAAQVLQIEPSPEPVTDTAERIKRNTQRMRSMIGDLLDFARGRLGGGIPVTRAPTDLQALAAEAVADARHVYSDRVIEYEATGALKGEWDASRLEQVFTNLIGNAIRHGEDPIRVTLRDEGGSAVVTVSNRGRLIPAATIAGIFEPFRHRAAKRTEGLGLGLYIVSEIVRAHGGTITVSSSKSAGTSFVTRWPKR